MDTTKEILIKISRIDITKLSDNDALNLLISITSLAIATLSLAIAVIVLFYAAYQFISKRGSRFYGAFSIFSSVWSSQKYIGEIILENTKDKAAAISTIYLRIGRNVYVELIDYSDSPKIMAPFETIKISFREGVSGYISSTFKVDLDSLLDDTKARKTLIIATPQGLSKVKNYKTIWNIYIESLKNFFIVPVHPVRKYYNGEYCNDALQFIVTHIDGLRQLKEYRLYRNRTYEIGRVTIKTNDFIDATELKKFLTDSDIFNSLTVARVGYSYDGYENYETRKITHHGFFGTYITGPIVTKLHTLELKISNKRKKK